MNMSKKSRLINTSFLATVSYLLRAGLAAVFLYAAASSFTNPSAWIGYFPRFLVILMPANILLGLFSAYEIVLTIWLISGFYMKYAALMAAATLAAIIAANLASLDILFRDIAIFFAALALAVLHW